MLENISHFFYSSFSHIIFFGDSSFGATKIFHAFDIPHKLVPDQENSGYFMRLGNTALSQ